MFQEIAQNFKEQGNDYFQGRRYREALGFYTQGVDAKPTDPGLQVALLINRAACNLELSETLDLSIFSGILFSISRNDRELWNSAEGLFKSTPYQPEIEQSLVQILTRTFIFRTYRRSERLL